jgi:hypothetical protein
MSADDEIVVGYWNIRGLAAPLRAMVLFAGKPLTAPCYQTLATGDASRKWNYSQWKAAKAKLKPTCPLINLPYVQIGDTLVTQSNACFAFLGRRLGLWGRGEAEEIECEMYLCESTSSVLGVAIRMSHPPSFSFDVCHVCH